jgi:phosphoserine phosphatase RsbU/P
MSTLSRATPAMSGSLARCRRQEMSSSGQEVTPHRADACTECTRSAFFEYPAGSEVAADRMALALHSLQSRNDALAAAALHRSLLPAALPAVAGLDLAARYVTGSGTVGGDWYDVFILPDGRLGAVLGDVAGSGLEAGVIMGRMRSALRACVLEATDPAAVLRMLDRKVQYFEPDAMATVLYGLYAPGSGRLSISSAGHLPPVLAAPGRLAGLLPLQPDPPIGTADDPQRRTVTVCIPPGALLCCFTDGLVERRHDSIDHGIGELSAILGEQVCDGPSLGGTPEPLAEEACAAVMRSLPGNAASDDIAVLMLHRPLNPHREHQHPSARPSQPCSTRR